MELIVVETVLLSILVSAVVFCALYLLQHYVLPQAKRPHAPEITLPHSRPVCSPSLQLSLYSQPSANFIDPRNSVADTELPRSRWSTSFVELSNPASQERTPTHSLTLSVYNKMHKSSRSDPTTTTLAERRRRCRPKLNHPPTQDLWIDVERDHTRPRSKSDSILLTTRRGLLAHSYTDLLPLSVGRQNAATTADLSNSPSCSTCVVTPSSGRTLQSVNPRDVEESPNQPFAEGCSVSTPNTGKMIPPCDGRCLHQRVETEPFTRSSLFS